MANNKEMVKAYDGSNKYAFISYAHANSDKVIPVLQELDQDCYRFWYDAGIQVGSQWPEVVANHLLNCETAVFFLSRKFAMSQNCDREVHFAVSKRKKMICVTLEDVELPSDMAMQLSVAEFIDGRSMNSKQIAREVEVRLTEELLGDGIEGYEKKTEKKKNINLWQILTIVLAVLILAGSVLTIGHFKGWFSQTGVSGETIDGEDGEQVEITRFNDELTRDILLGSYNSEALYLCGNVLMNDAETVRYKNGSWFIGEEMVEEGTLDDCDTIASKEKIKYLMLANQQIKSFASLSKMTQLIYLDISSNPVTDLSFLENMSNLQVLKIADIEATDYSVLSSLENLEELTISVEQLDKILDVVDLGEVDVIIK